MPPTIPHPTDFENSPPSPSSTTPQILPISAPTNINIQQRPPPQQERPRTTTPEKRFQANRAKQSKTNFSKQQSNNRTLPPPSNSTTHRTHNKAESQQPTSVWNLRDQAYQNWHTQRPANAFPTWNTDPRKFPNTIPNGNSVLPPFNLRTGSNNDATYENTLAFLADLITAVSNTRVNSAKYKWCSVLFLSFLQAVEQGASQPNLEDMCKTYLQSFAIHEKKRNPTANSEWAESFPEMRRPRFKHVQRYERSAHHLSWLSSLIHYLATGQLSIMASHLGLPQITVSAVAAEALCFSADFNIRRRVLEEKLATARRAFSRHMESQDHRCEPISGPARAYAFHYGATNYDSRHDVNNFSQEQTQILNDAARKYPEVFEGKKVMGYFDLCGYHDLTVLEANNEKVNRGGPGATQHVIFNPPTATHVRSLNIQDVASQRPPISEILPEQYEDGHLTCIPAERNIQKAFENPTKFDQKKSG